MAVASFLLVLLMKVMIVMSQKPTITLSSNNLLTCQNELIQYSCTVNSTRAQWVANPFTSGDPVTFNSAGSPRTFEIEDADDNVIIRFLQFSLNPFITAMLVNGKLLATFNITCIDLVNSFESQPVKYISGAQASVEPVTVPIAKSLPSTLTLGSFEVSYQPSLTHDVQYVVRYCTNDGCWNQTLSGNGGILTVNCTGKITMVNANIIAKNRCNKESSPALIEDIAIDCIDNQGTEGLPQEAAIIPAVIGSTLLVYGITLTVVLVLVLFYVKTIKSKIREEAAVESEHISMRTED